MKNIEGIDLLCEIEELQEEDPVTTTDKNPYLARRIEDADPKYDPFGIL